MPNNVAPFAVRSGEGTPLETPTGGSVQIKAHTRNPNGSLTVLEFVISPREGPALQPTFAGTSCGACSRVTSDSRRVTRYFGRRRAAWRAVRVARRTASRTPATRQAGCS